MSAFSGTSRTCRGYFATAAVGAETDMDRACSFFRVVAMSRNKQSLSIASSARASNAFGSKPVGA